MSGFRAKVGESIGYNQVRLHPEYRFIQQFGILNLSGQENFNLDTKETEFALLVLEGACNIEVEGKDYGCLQPRNNVFYEIPTAVYVPADSKFSISGDKAKIAICGGKCKRKTEPTLITPQQVKTTKIGKDNWAREVRLIIGPESPAVNIILGETLNPPGNWSGIPPARHEENRLPEESLHEELYFFKTDKPQGWGIERIYSPERDVNEFIYLEDNVVTYMPWGYHQIVAAPGYTLYYLFFLAGEGSKLLQFEDPAHNWIKSI